MKNIYKTDESLRRYVTMNYNRKQKLSKRKNIEANYYKDYTKEEDAFILADNGMTLMEKAAELNRTFAAITGRRQRLLAKENGEANETWRNNFKVPRKRPSQRKRKIITKNCIKCKKCGDIIESRNVHDFKTCRCGACSVDGGHEYLRRLGNPDDWEDISEYKQV